MADSKKSKIDNTPQDAIENPPAAELTEVDDIVEYIQPSSLEILKARYAAVEEDEQIRNEGFEPIKKSGLIKKVRPESTVFGYYASPVSSKDEIRTDVDSPLSRVFDETKTDYAADTVSFGDIELEESEEKAAPTEETPVTQPDNTASAVNNRYNFDTHTRVVYIDENIYDGIKRNTDDELSAAFNTDDNGKKRRRLPWSAKKK